MIRPSTAVAVGLAVWTVPAVQWAAYWWLGRPHPFDPGCTRPSPLLDALARRVRLPDPLLPPTSS